MTIYKKCMSFDNTPTISVIITAYNRKMFVESALKSLLSQKVDLKKVELIIISNFEIKYKYEFGALNNIKMILLDDTIGKYLKTGILEARGEIIVFLDDDDIMAPDKLNVVCENFKEHRNLAYYHNSVFYINDKGKLINYVRMVERRNIKKIKAYYSKINLLDNIKEIVESSGDFNLSSISIRKEVFLPIVDFLDKLEGNTDGFFFWFSVILQWDIMLDNEKLTYYRVHSENVSNSNNYKSKTIEISKQIRTFDILLEYLDERETNNSLNIKVSNWIHFLKEEYKLMYLIFSKCSRFNILKQLKRLYNISVKADNALKLRLTIISFIYILSPKMAFYIYEILQE